MVKHFRTTFSQWNEHIVPVSSWHHNMVMEYGWWHHESSRHIFAWLKPSLNYWVVRSRTWCRSVCGVWIVQIYLHFLNGFLSQLQIPPKQMESVKIRAWNLECGNTLLHIVISVWVSLMIVDSLWESNIPDWEISDQNMEGWIGESSVNGCFQLPEGISIFYI